MSVSTTLSYAEFDVRNMSIEELKLRLMFAKGGEGYSVVPNPHQLMGLIYAELIRRHSAECSDLDYGFNPFA